jgi:type IV secretion system protein VirB9
MDRRRFLIPALAGLLLSGCAAFRGETTPVVGLVDHAMPAPAAAIATVPLSDPVVSVSEIPETTPVVEARPAAIGDDAARPYLSVAADRGSEDRTSRRPDQTGRRAIAAANRAAAAPSHRDRFEGGIQVFAWEAGRVFEVWTAPLRVTTLTLGEGETVIAKAAGDTVRWQIGEAASGEGPARRTHVMLKPLERGLETNLVLTTNRRVYLIDLKSGPPDGFNAAVAWTPTPTREAVPATTALEAPVDLRVADPVVMPEGPLDARYRLEPQGRRPRWTPSAVFNDGRRTFIAFDADLQVDEAPALFVIAANGEAQLANYRQAGGLFIVDRVFDRAELRLGDRRPQVVRIRRLQGDRS